MGNSLSRYKEHRNILIDIISHVESPSWIAAKLEKLSEKEKSFLLYVSICEGLHGLLYSAIPDKAFPLRLYEELKSEYYKTIARWILLTEKFLPIAIEIESNGIEYLILKGFVYSHYLYSSPGLRPIKDIDLLIHPKDVGVIDALLQKYGFEQTISDEMNYSRYDGIDIVLDVHTKLMFPPAVDLWENLKEIKIENHSFYTLDLENQMVYLISHPLIQHGYLMLIWVYDFLLFVRRHNKELDHARFQTLTSMYGLEIPSNHFFAFCKKHFSKTWPELERFVIKKPMRRKSFIVNAIFRKSIYAPRPFDMGFVLYFFLIPGLQKKIMFIKEILFPDERFLEKRHTAIPGKLIRRIFRPLFMIWKAISRTIQWILS